MRHRLRAVAPVARAYGNLEVTEVELDHENTSLN